MTLVIDASVVGAAMFGEPGADAANKILRGPDRLLAPDLILPEYGSIVRKRFRRKELTLDEAAEQVVDFLALPIRTVASTGLLAHAVEIALTADRTVYDALYVALAAREGAMLITADERLVRGLTGTPFAAVVRALE